MLHVPLPGHGDRVLDLAGLLALAGGLHHEGLIAAGGSQGGEQAGARWAGRPSATGL
ncbi:hypothetical protein [Streptomyces sp. NPDC048481]|uniref:hypothetical protein n=1 Tax=Streptomyces sp. NPDC048481 TaxID=3365557 RepID=UPI00371FFA92